MHARGKTFEPSDKSLIPPLSLAYKKRVYSPARIRYPMKRVDFDPNGAPAPPARGAQHPEPGRQQVRAHHLGRGARHRHQRDAADQSEEYGPTAILYQSDQHGENKVVHGPHGCGRKLLRLFGGYTLQVRQPDSWEGWWWGAKHVWGCEPVGQQVPQKNLLWDISKNAELLLFWGCDQETTTWGWRRPASQPVELLVDRAGHQADLHRPGLQLRQRGARRQVDPRPPQHRRRALSGHRHQWFKNGTYDKEYLRDPRLRRRQVRGLRHGPGGRRTQEPGVGGPHHRCPFPHHQGAGRRVGLQADDGRHRQRRPRHPRPLRHGTRPSAGAVPGHAGPGQAGLQPVQDDRVGAAPRRRAGVAAGGLGVHQRAGRVHRRHPRRHQPQLRAQEPGAQGHPRGLGRLVGRRGGVRSPREPVRPLHVSGRRRAPAST